METVGQQKLWSFGHDSNEPIRMSCTEVRKSDAVRVDSYLDLAKETAALQYENRDLILMFRGQSRDHRNQKGNTSLKPNIFRPEATADALSKNALQDRYKALMNSEKKLIASYRASNFKGSMRVKRQQILRWSILQHYEIVRTPLLDVTHSLRIAASFATIAARHDNREDAYIFVLGVPNLSGAVTASADAGIQMIRLSSICPHSAIRPHIQEGYLLGEYPEMSSVDQTHNYMPFEIEFGRRLVAKFTFNHSHFWSSSQYFSLIPKEALYPANDPMLDITAPIAQQYSGSQ